MKNLTRMMKPGEVEKFSGRPDDIVIPCVHFVGKCDRRHVNFMKSYGTYGRRKEQCMYLFSSITRNKRRHDDFVL